MHRGGGRVAGYGLWLSQEIGIVEGRQPTEAMRIEDRVWQSSQPTQIGGAFSIGCLRGERSERRVARLQPGNGPFQESRPNTAPAVLSGLALASIRLPHPTDVPAAEHSRARGQRNLVWQSGEVCPPATVMQAVRRTKAGLERP